MEGSRECALRRLPLAVAWSLGNRRKQARETAQKLSSRGLRLCGVKQRRSSRLSPGYMRPTQFRGHPTVGPLPAARVERGCGGTREKGHETRGCAYILEYTSRAECSGRRGDACQYGNFIVEEVSVMRVHLTSESRKVVSSRFVRPQRRGHQGEGWVLESPAADESVRRGALDIIPSANTALVPRV